MKDIQKQKMKLDYYNFIVNIFIKNSLIQKSLNQNEIKNQGIINI